MKRSGPSFQRRLMIRGLGVAGALAAGVSLPARSGERHALQPYLASPWEGAPALAPDRIAALLEERLGPFTPVAGDLDLSLPALAESGNSVRMSLTARIQPDRGEERVQRMLVIAPRNPHPLILDARLGELAQPRLTSNIRLAESQTVLAYAQLASGEVWVAQAPIRVTIGACKHLDFRY